MTLAGEKEALVAQRALKSLQPEEAGKASGWPSREAEMAPMRESGGALATKGERAGARGRKRKEERDRSQKEPTHQRKREGEKIPEKRTQGKEEAAEDQVGLKTYKES